MDTASRLGRLARHLALAGAALLLMAPGALAAGSGDRVLRTSEGMTAANLSVLMTPELGTGAWSGGIVAAPKASLCEEAGARRVINGAAASEFHGPGMKVQDSVLVLRTAAMVQRDFAVTYGTDTAALVRCFRGVAARQLEPNEKLVSVAVRQIPRIGTYTQAVRAVIAVKGRSGATSQVAFDAILVGSGRSEATLVVTSPMSSFVDLWEQQIAQKLAGKLAV